MPTCSRKTLWTALVLALGYLIYGTALLRLDDVDFWNANNDYVELSLAHGMSGAQRLSGEILDMGYFQVTHPGIPFQLASTLAFKLSAPAAGGGFQKQAEATLVNPGQFWFVSRLIALVLTTGAIFGFCYFVGSRFQSATAQFSILGVFSFFPSYYGTFYSLTNELFAVPAITLCATAALYSLEKPESWARAAGLGAFCAVAYSIKLNYIAFFVAGTTIPLLGLALGYWRFRTALTYALAYSLAFGIAILGIARLWLGSGGLAGMLHQHFDVFLFSNGRGRGSAGIIDWAGLSASLNYLTKGLPYFSALLAICIIATAISLLRKLRNGRPLGPVGLWQIWLTLGMSLALVAALKHFSVHFFVLPAVAMSLLIARSIAEAPRAVRIAAVVLLAVPALGTFREAFAYVRAFSKFAAEDRQLDEQVHALPINPGQLRLWCYRTGTAEFSRCFVALNSSTPQVSALVRSIQPKDLTTYTAPGWPISERRGEKLQTVDWRYLILPRTFYESIPAQSAESLRQAGAASVPVLKNARIVVIERKQ